MNDEQQRNSDIRITLSAELNELDDLAKRICKMQKRISMTFYIEIALLVFLILDTISTLLLGVPSFFMPILAAVAIMCITTFGGKDD